jgi:hypothetical protein
MRWPGGDETGGAQREWYRLTHGKNLYCPDQKFSKIQIKQPFQHERNTTPKGGTFRHKAMTQNTFRVKVLSFR